MKQSPRRARPILPLLLASLVFATAVDAAARPRIEVAAPSCDAIVTARYVALLEPTGDAIVLSAAPFPGSENVALSSAGRPDRPIPGHSELRVTGAGGQLHWLQGRIPDGAVGCVGFDKDRFTWKSDVLTYVGYLGELLGEAQRLDPGRNTLLISDRTVRLEVRRPGERAVLEGPEGAMLGFGKVTDPVRFFFLPVLLGADGEDALVRVLRNRESAFGERATEHLTWLLLEGAEPSRTDTEPAFEVRRVD